jgi:hypothetical protein
MRISCLCVRWRGWESVLDLFVVRSLSLGLAPAIGMLLVSLLAGCASRTHALATSLPRTDQAQRQPREQRAKRMPLTKLKAVPVQVAHATQVAWREPAPAAAQSQPPKALPQPPPRLQVFPDMGLRLKTLD